MIAIDRTKPPLTPELPPFRLPRVEEHRFANGMTVLLVEDRRLPLVTLRLGFPAGSKFEPAELAGLADETAAVMTEGTASRTAKQIADESAAIGGALRADAGTDSLLIAGGALAEHTGRLLELVADVARNAVFPEDEVALRKENRKQELLAQRSEVAFLADEKFNEVVFSPHPYARQEPTLASIERLNRDALAAFRDRFVTPREAVLVLLGDLPPDPLVVIERNFGGWQAGDAAAPPPAEFPPPRRSVVLIDRPGSVQADVRIGRMAVTRTHPDYFPLTVGNTVLGGGASSRLFMNVREEKGFAYDARSVVAAYRDAGAFAAVTQVRNEVIGEALETVLDEMRRMSEQPVGADELAEVKNYLSGTFVIRMETMDALASQLAAIRLHGLGIEYLEQYTSRVRAVGAGDIRAAAARYIEPGPAAIVVVGDAQALRAPLERFGVVQVEEAPEG